jgi:hypothetical protein
MKLLAVYIGLVLVGDLIAYGVGRTVEQFASQATSLAVFLALFFLVFWAGWKAAVRLT